MIAVLSFLRFTVILDFMIVSPLGAILMPALGITPAQFGVVVSAYALSAGFSSFLTAGFADRFDRKKILLFFYGGFVLGTLLCGLAPSFHFLLLARVVTGLFGGVIDSTVMAITTDLFSFEVRGRVMGTLQTAFAASQVLGLPLGLYFSNKWGWHSPFLSIVVIASLVGVVIALRMKPIVGHLNTRVDKNPFHHLTSTITNPVYIPAFFATGLLSLGGFMIMPFGSAFAVHNLKIDMEHLPLVFMVTGLTTIVAGPIIGWLCDVYGKFKVFVFGAVLTAMVSLIYTHLGETPLVWVMVVYSVLFVGIFSRMIPAQALVSAIPAPAHRGAFMAISSSLQQLSGGVGAYIAGLIVSEAPDGRILNFDILGYILIGTVIITTVLIYRIHKRVPEPN